MLRSLNQLIGYTVRASDGPIGHVHEFYFDDHSWGIRYMVADIGKWIKGRKVLLAPAAFEQPVWDERTFPVAVTKAQVEGSPDIDTDQPIVRQIQARLHRHYGWEMYFAEEGLMGGASPEISIQEENANKNGKPFDPHLRTTRVVTGHHVEATDGLIGHVSDFIADDEKWVIRYLVVDTRHLLPRKQVLLVPSWTRHISWEAHTIYVDLSRAQIGNGPSFDSAAPVNRQVEERVYDYYGRPKYWHSKSG